MVTTPHYALTLVQQAQAQKEVTVNEALMRIDKLLKAQATGGSLPDWRVDPTAVTDTGGEAVAMLAAMAAGENAPDIRIAPATTRTIVFDIPAMADDGMVTFELDSDTDNTYTITYEESFNGGSSYSSPVNISLIAPNADTCYRRQKFDISAGAARKVRLAFAHNKTASGSDVGYRIIRGLKYVAFDADDLHDYVVLIGASITQITARARDWEGWWSEYFRRDAVVFNESVSGWAATNFASGVAAIIARHPRARYFVAEMGGNDVTATRPYADMSRADYDTFEADMRTGLDAIRATGAKLVLSRISYRNYTASPAVSGTSVEQNGSKPYNEGLIDKLIAEYSPQAWSGTRGMVDPYGYLAANIFLIDLAIDAAGVHPYAYGGYRFSQYMAKAVGAVLFEGREYSQIAESATAGVPGAKEDVIISFGNTPAFLWDPLRVGDMDSPEGMTYDAIRGSVLESKLNLVNTEGERCGIGIEITTVAGGITATGYAGATDTLFVKRAKTGLAFIASGGSFVFELNGLNDNATYRIEVLPSRDSIASRLTAVTIDAVTHTADAANNDTATTVHTGVSPTGGVIEVTVQAHAGSGAAFGYANVVRIMRE